MKPGDGIYLHCVGEAARGLAPMSAKNSSPLYDETNTFWEIHLKGSFADMLSHARKLAEEEIQGIVGKLGNATLPETVRAHLQNLTQTAQKELATGDLYLSQSDDVQTRARALRAFTRSQVRARQVRELLKFAPVEAQPELNKV
jgi:phage-related tail protein